MLISKNPYTQKEFKKYQSLQSSEVETRITKAHATFGSWSKTSFSERRQKFTALSEVLGDNKEDLAKIATQEMGKPFSQAESEVEKCQWVCRYYADNAESFLRPESMNSDYQTSEIHFSPLGCLLAIMPWNYPYWQVFRFAAPSIMAGNVGLLKHASNVMGCAQAIEDCFAKSGFPKGVFTNLEISSDEVENVIRNPHVRGISLTGSLKAGQKVAEMAGSVVKPLVLELGGSDAYIIREDADLEKAVEKCTQTRLQNTGQSCIAGKRFIVQKNIREKFEQMLKESFESKKWGDPMDPESDLGPMARDDLRDELHEQVRDSVEQGAKLLLGGEIPDEVGSFYPPSILTNVRPGMRAFEEELFGPVAAIIEYSDDDEAIDLANSSQYGLGGGIFSKDLEVAKAMASQRLDTGAIFINDFVKSDPRLPFGGVKDSGYGRELSPLGIKEFVNIKTICVSE